MKRPPGIWFLLSVGVLWLSLENVCGLRATSLIFGRSPPTTSTTETSDSAASSQPTVGEIEASTEAVSNVTKPTLTGIPQIDYIWDPNLPKELNGYNLSEYPFYERVPEDINFKCDGLHDGFYASVPHKCQVYHHCLFGTRYDFLCANYTAFDQKTFICHFVSEVDCLNSKKYWHRNDALYKAASTTTQKPLIVYTSPPKTSIEDSAEAPVSPRRPPPIHRRPLRRGRPHYDYYEYEDEFDDDDYEERPRIEGRRRKKRPRPRPRPIYEDDYEEYEDDRYERRGGGRRRPQSTRRRNKDRRKYEDYDEDMEEDRRYHKRRPSDDFDSDEDRRRSRPKGSRRPVEDDYDDELPQNDRPLSSSSKESTGDKPIIKPASGSSIYDRPRTAPRIKPPVPKNEANKFAYKPINSRPTSTDDPEYYDDYEEEVVSVKKNHRKPEMSESKRHSTRLDEETDRRKSGSGSAVRNRQTSRDDYEEPPRRPHKNRPQYSHSRSRNNSNKRQPVVDEYYDDYIEDEATLEESKTKLERTREKSTTTTTPPPTTTTTTREPPRERPESIVRVVKRPFLPSRGGNPLSARGLQPVGLKAPDRRPETKQETTEQPEPEIIDTIKPLFKPSPSVIKVPVRGKLASQTESETISNRPRSNLKQNNDNSRDFTGPRTTQKPKLATNQDPFDIVDDDEEYDVTLNDALNPTIPNLPVRSFPTGFSNTGYQQQQQRYVVNPILHPSTADYAYQQAKSNNRNQYVDNKGQFSTITGQNYPSRVTQAYYTGYN